MILAGGKGANGRVTLKRKATVSSYGMVLPSNSVRAMDISRQHVAAYEYLQHVAEYVQDFTLHTQLIFIG